MVEHCATDGARPLARYPVAGLDTPHVSHLKPSQCCTYCSEPHLRSSAVMMSELFGSAFNVARPNRST